MLKFWKYSGAGNDFILIDSRDQETLPLEAGKIRQLAARGTGVGADGVIFLRRSARADFLMQIFNRDGSQPAMCGNGLRCLAKFAQDLGLIGDACRIEVGGQIYLAAMDGERVTVTMAPPSELRFGLELQLFGQTVPYDHVDTGVPHAVLFVEELENCPVAEVGAALGSLPQFQPSGVNVTFVRENDASNLAIRTFERGVGAETLACGTGAAAAALAAAHHRGAGGGQTAVRVRSGESLTIEFSFDPLSLSMAGPARCVYVGEIATNRSFA